MEHKKTLRIWGGFLLLLLLTIVFLIWNLFAGSVRLKYWKSCAAVRKARSAAFCCRSACRGLLRR